MYNTTQTLNLHAHATDRRRSGEDPCRPQGFYSELGTVKKKTESIMAIWGKNMFTILILETKSRNE